MKKLILLLLFIPILSFGQNSKIKDFKITKSELNAIFRNESHPKYMECGDQFLRNFLDGLIIHLRGPMPPSKDSKPPIKKQ